MSKTHVCEQCNKPFTRKYTLRRHLASVHGKEQSTASEENSDMECNDRSNHYKPLNEKHSTDEESYADERSSEEEESEQDLGQHEEESDREVEDNDESEDEDSESDINEEDVEENDAYYEWYQQAFEETQEIRNEKYQKYIQQGMSEEQAKEKAYMKTLWALQKVFFNKYMLYLWSDVYLKEDETHNEIVDDLEYKLEAGMDISKALKRVVAKHRHKFDELFLYDKDEVERMEAEDEDNI